jgi:hypothetical protein
MICGSDCLRGERFPIIDRLINQRYYSALIKAVYDIVRQGSTGLFGSMEKEEQQPLLCYCA